MSNYKNLDHDSKFEEARKFLNEFNLNDGKPPSFEQNQKELKNETHNFLTLMQNPNIAKHQIELVYAFKNGNGMQKQNKHFENIAELPSKTVQSEIKKGNLNPKSWQQASSRTYSRLYQLRQKGVNPINFNDTQYPKRMHGQHQNYPILFVKGNLDALNQQPNLAIVGDNNSNSLNQQLADKYTAHFAKHNFNVMTNMDNRLNQQVGHSTVKNQGTPIIITGKNIANESFKNIDEYVEKNNGCIISTTGWQSKKNPIDQTKNQIDVANLIGHLSDGAIVINGNSNNHNQVNTTIQALTNNEKQIGTPDINQLSKRHTIDIEAKKFNQKIINQYQGTNLNKQTFKPFVNQIEANFKQLQPNYQSIKNIRQSLSQPKSYSVSNNNAKNNIINKSQPIQKPQVAIHHQPISQSQTLENKKIKDLANDLNSNITIHQSKLSTHNDIKKSQNKIEKQKFNALANDMKNIKPTSKQVKKPKKPSPSNINHQNSMHDIINGLKKMPNVHPNKIVEDTQSTDIDGLDL